MSYYIVETREKTDGTRYLRIATGGGVGSYRRKLGTANLKVAERRLAETTAQDGRHICAVIKEFISDHVATRYCKILNTL